MMKAISGAVIALAGAVLFASGVVGKGDQGTAAMLLGIVIGIAGLAAWATEMYKSSAD